MVKLRTILDTRRAKADGTFTILFRITDHKHVKYISLGVSVLKNQWDTKSNNIKKTHPNAGILNSSISKRFYEIQKAIVKLEDDGNYSFENLKEMLLPKETKVEVKGTCFKDYSQKIIQDMINVRRTGNALIYQTAVNRVIAFCNNESLTIEEIDYTFLDNFKQQLTKDGAKINTIGNYFRSLRAIYNKSIKAKLVDRSLYPFVDITIKTERTAKRALDIQDIVRIYNSKYKYDSPKWHARNYFFLSFGLRGMSFIDMAYLTERNIEKGRITYKRQKTGTELNIKLVPLAMSILNHYRGGNSKFLLPIFPNDIYVGGIEAKAISRQWIKTTNKWLRNIASDCEVDANITTYVTRHSWATIAKRLGYSNELIAECLGHQYGNKITNTYLDSFDNYVVEEANQRVIQCIQPCKQIINYPYKFVLRYFNHQNYSKARRTNSKLLAHLQCY